MRRLHPLESSQAWTRAIPARLASFELPPLRRTRCLCAGMGSGSDHTGVGDGVSGHGGIASLSRPTRNALRVRVGRESEAIPPLRVRVGRESEAIPPLRVRVVRVGRESEAIPPLRV